MVLEVEIRKNAATSPHINAVAEGQAEEYFWRPEEGRREQRVRSPQASLMCLQRMM